MNQIEQLLIDLGIIDPKQVEIFYPNVRDKHDVKVMRCQKSGVIFLSDIAAEMDYGYYENQKGVNYWSSATRELALKETFEDDNRRFQMFKDEAKGKLLMDIGTGLGGILDLFKQTALSVAGVELQKDIRAELVRLGYSVYASIEDVVHKNKYDFVTLFHVFEHLFDPLDSLIKIKSIMKEKGKIIIEVPHARDFLFNQLDVGAFKEFTFWSEHLILHTKESLHKMLETAGFRNIDIQGFQRYPLANHLYWLRNQKPGGQKIWKNLSTSDLDNAYSHLLKNINQTDTLIASAIK